ncbi:hypothetical protein EJB05_09047, partial [Eragrostis curvula]
MPTSNTKTVSTCAPETEQGTHVFNIVGYSRHRGIGINKFIRSAQFSIGDSQWFGVFYPDGVRNDCVTFGFYLCRPQDTMVRTSFELRLVDQITSLSVLLCKRSSGVFTTTADSANGGFVYLIKRSEFETSRYLRDDRFTIEFSITIIKEVLVPECKSFPKIDVPSSDMAVQFGKLLETKDGADVNFTVGSEIFMAHKLVLATRYLFSKLSFKGL